MNPAEIKDYVTVAGVLSGGLWASWKWGYGEYLRRKTSIRCIAGDISATVLPHNRSTVIVCIEAKWVNTSSYREDIDRSRTKIEIYKIDQSYPEGPILRSNERLKIISRILPYKNLERFWLGPKADYVYRAHWVLSRNERYLVRWKLYSTRNEDHDELTVRTRELMVDTGESPDGYGGQMKVSAEQPVQADG